jgi:hypothetical protein
LGFHLSHNIISCAIGGKIWAQPGYSTQLFFTVGPVDGKIDLT